MPATTLDPAPLLALAASRTTSSTGEELAEVLDISRRTVARYQRGQRVRLYAADRLAIRLDLHPLNIWPDFHAGDDAA